MQKKFVIIDNDELLNNLIEEQVSIVFEKNFNIKFLKTHNINSLNVLDTIDLIIVNFKFIKDNYNIFINLANEKKSKIIVIFDNHVDISQFKKFNNFNFVVKPFRLKQIIDIMQDFFISYETHQKYIKISRDLIFRPETKTLLNKNKVINLTEKESRLLNFILENKENVIKKDEILINVWGITERINTHTLETHIYSLKKKLDAFEYHHSFICSDNLGGYYFNKLMK
ncbi:MAG: winged helix family transcriptional regulator [Alphaproteobacteria bacterium]|nr:MAG: winged helix family transcriptional regulator [Alphaproteobacteria bacterium]